MRKLKKLVVQIPIDPRYKDFFDKIEKFQVQQIHRLDKDVIITTQLMKFKDPTFHPKNLIGIYGIEYIEILSEDKVKNEYVCFAKTRWPQELRQFFEDSELIMNAPILTDEKNLTISFTIDAEKMDSIYEQLKRYGDNFKIISVSSKLAPNMDNLFMLLTDRQREIIYYAVEQGYYEIPRKINTDKLAEKFGMSQSALSEHLRKIERIVFNAVFK
jgi:predicted DNA binding protein